MSQDISSSSSSLMQLNALRSSIAHASDACVWVVVWAVKRQTAREEKLLGEESLVNEKS